MGNRQTTNQKRTAAGSDLPEMENVSTCSSSITGDSTTKHSTFGNSGQESGMDIGICTSSSEEEFGDHIESNVDDMRKAVAEHNSAALRMEYNMLEDGWDSDFSTISPSEMTTTDQSALPSARTDQSTPFRLPYQNTSSETSECPQTTTSNEECEAAENSSQSSSSLNSTDTWFGLPTLIETSIKSRLEEFARPGMDDELWIAKAHSYFDREVAYKRKQKRPGLGRRLRIGPLQKKSWTAIMREV
ncbi:hypothetical protein Y032_0363g3538 [Ancylostoma ceylanicum]|nr:hypothetical protein Y032_0363g3538 [Ancylostoma ceylanicum]